MSKQYDYNVIYIGAGVGATNGAVPLANKGFKVAIVEAEAIGGTCPNWGCTAKYTLDVPTDLAHRANHFTHIFNDNPLKVNWKENMARKHRNIDSGPATGMEHRIDKAGIDVLWGFGHLKDNHTVEVKGKTVTAEKFVLAPGLTPHHLDIPGTELSNDSRHFLSIDNLPKRVVVIGTGYVGIELATLANAGGADVTVMMHGDRALRGFYKPFSEALIKSLEQRGMKFIRSANVSAFEEKGNAKIVKYGNGKELTTDYILDASGRVPNLEPLHLENAGVKYNKRGIEVDDHLKTNIDNIYASGDVIDSKIDKLSPTATYEVKYLTKLFNHETTEPMKMPPIPTAVFTSPRIAKAGVTVDEAKKHNDYHVVTKELSGHMYYKATGQDVAKRALIFNGENRLVGAEELSDKADDAASVYAILISLKATNDQISNILRLFPSMTSDILSDF